MAWKVRLNIRIEPEQRELLNRAAEMIGTTQTAFVLTAALARAREVMVAETGISFRDG